jgi:hypothetical protein
MASKHTFIAYGDGFWVKNSSGVLVQIIDKDGYWIGPDITSTSPSTSPSSSVSVSASSTPSTSPSTSPSSSASSSASSSPSAS